MTALGDVDGAAIADQRRCQQQWGDPVLEVKLGANVVDEETSRISNAVLPTFMALAARLNGDYGGAMEHLWIDLELLRSRAKVDGGAKHPFRFQKRVSGRGHFGLPDLPDSFNVGHFSVRPDFDHLLSLPADQVVRYVLWLIYRASGVLVEKRRKLGGFDAELFLTRFKTEAQTLGFDFESPPPIDEMTTALQPKE